MKIRLHIPNFTFPGGPEELGSKLVEISHTTDGCGFFNLWVMDHFFQIGRGGSGFLGPAEDEIAYSEEKIVSQTRACDFYSPSYDSLNHNILRACVFQ